MTEISIEKNVRLALGDLTLQLIAARSEIEALKAELDNRAEPEFDLAPKAKPNGKATRNEQSRSDQ
jgi:hypothetical protein